MKKKYLYPIIGLLLAIICGFMFYTKFYLPSDNTEHQEKTQFFKKMYNNFSDSSGCYFNTTDGFLYYFDYNSQKSSFVCSKANCLHREPTEDMPEEMYCDAYINYSPIFAIGETLYIVTPDHSASDYSSIVISSDLDGSNKKQITKTEGVIASFYVHGNILYYATLDFEIEQLENGGGRTTGAQSAALRTLSLADGTTETLLTLDSAFSSSLQFMGIYDDILYMQYVLYEEKVTPENMYDIQPTIEYFTLSAETNTIAPAFEPLWNSSYQFICQQDNLVYFLQYYDTRTISVSLCSYDLETSKLNTIVSDIYYDQYADNKIIFFEMDSTELENTSYAMAEKQGYYYDLVTFETIAFPYLHPYKICDEYENAFVTLYLDHDTLNSYWRYMLKEDYFNGNEDYINMLE